MGERILLVNPIKARKSRAVVKTTARKRIKRGATMATKRKARRSAAQKRATAKMVAANRSRRSIRRKRNPSKAAAYKAVPTMSANPVRRRRRRNPIAVASRRRRVARRRNPIDSSIKALFMPAITGAAGAVALDVAFAYLPLPDNLKAGPLKHVVKAAGAVALALIAGKVVKKAQAEAMGIGALTVIAHDMLKDVVTKFAPGVKMDGVGMYVGGMGYYSAGLPAGGYDVLPAPSSMGMYTAGYSGAGLETEAGYSYE